MEESVRSRVIRVINEVFNVEGEEYILGAEIGTDIALTSLDKMTLFISLEDEFDRTIPQEEVQDLATVKEVVDFIENKL